MRCPIRPNGWTFCRLSYWSTAIVAQIPPWWLTFSFLLRHLLLISLMRSSKIMNPTIVATVVVIPIMLE